MLGGEQRHTLLEEYVTGTHISKFSDRIVETISLRGPSTNNVLNLYRREINPIQL